MQNPYSKIEYRIKNKVDIISENSTRLIKEYIVKLENRIKELIDVEKIDESTSRFSAEVYDASELVPWIRTFICRITDFTCSNQELEAQFADDLKAMYALYDLEGGEAV